MVLICLIITVIFGYKAYRNFKEPLKPFKKVDYMFESYQRMAKEKEAEIRRDNPNLSDIEVFFAPNSTWCLTSYGVYWERYENGVAVYKEVFAYDSISDFSVNTISDDRHGVKFRFRYIFNDEMKEVALYVRQEKKTLTIDKLQIYMRKAAELAEGGKQ